MDFQELQIPKGVQYSNLNLFKIEEKRYRYYKGHKSDFSQLIILEDLNNDQLVDKKIEKVLLGDKIVYRFDWPKGVYVVKEFLDFDAQIRLAKSSVNDLILKPYRTNLFIYEDDDKKQCQQDQSLIKKNDKYCFNKKIRWTNLGYQYDWTNRVYPAQKTNIPEEIQELSHRANSLLLLQKEYTSESIIINFYSTTDYMTGHLDDAELDQESPIFSFSIGQSCVFLIGGEDKNQIPLAIRLNSGDLCVMSGASRKCYHGVPRVIDKSFNYVNPFKNENTSNEAQTDNKVYKNSNFNVFNYLQENRININIRQVYQPKEIG